MITEVSYDISDNLVKTLKDFRVVHGYLKFVYAAWSVDGSIVTPPGGLPNVGLGIFNWVTAYT
jgi:hypothetical protein